MLIKNKENKEYLIKIFDSILLTYENEPLNYINNTNINNISKSINNEEKYNELLINKVNNLEKKILNYLNVKLEMKLTGNEIVINLNGKNIGDIELNLITGVEFKNLEELHLSHNNISNIDIIKEFKSTKLKKIDLSFNKIENIDSLKDLSKKNKNIEAINLNNNLIKSADIFKENIFPKLKEISFDNNNIIKKDFEELRKIIGKNYKIKKIECLIKYDLNSSKETRTFGKEFVKNNIAYCKMIVNNKEYELNEFFKFKNEGKDSIEIKLKMDENISNFESMFNGCTSLLSFSGFLTHNNNISNIKKMFNGCKLLPSLPDIISKWNISNINNMSSLFSECILLKTIPDISKWNTSNVKNMSNLFYRCTSLIEIPDISKWNTSNVINMDSMFNGCKELKYLPDISQWNVSNVKYMDSMFSKCISINKFPDISKWNVYNVTTMRYLFSGCSSLSHFPDITKWEMDCAFDGMFENCPKIKSLIPNKFKI